MPQIKTIKIKHADGFAVINASDFDEATMELFDEAKPKERAKPKRSYRKKKATSEVTSGD
tara:strand:+ start:518 stop:697 length:180 start_codon:yes stop_codon:yes gene_type:complete